MLMGAVLLLSCDEGIVLPVDSDILVQISTDKSSYPSGGAAVVTVRNDDVVSFVYGGMCGYVLESQRGGEWEVQPTEPQICPGLGGVLAPGQAEVYNIQLPNGLPNGQYRVRVAFFTGATNTAENRVYRRSNVFTITNE